MAINTLRNYAQQLSVLSPAEFEHVVAEWLRCLGWQGVKVQPMSDDRGKDIIGVDPHNRIGYVEVKKHHGVIGRPVVQKLLGSMTADKIRFGIIVTTSTFSKPAVEEARRALQSVGTEIRLVDGREFLTSVNVLIASSPTVATPFPYCEKCGAPVSGMKYCNQCGSPVPAASVTDATTILPPLPRASAPVPDPVRGQATGLSLWWQILIAVTVIGIVVIVAGFSLTGVLRSNDAYTISAIGGALLLGACCMASSGTRRVPHLSTGYVRGHWRRSKSGRRTYVKSHRRRH